MKIIIQKTLTIIENKYLTYYIQVQPTIIPTTGPRSKVKAPPPHKNPLATQLPYKIDETGLEYSTSAPA